MKVEGPKSVRSSTPVRRKDKASKDSGTQFKVDQPSEDVAAAPVAGAGPLAAVEALLPLQEVTDATTGRAKAIRRGNDLLDRLDEIRAGLLAGAIPRGKLEDLVHAVQTRLEAVDDPRLVETLAEIELRARVELAKLKVLP